MSPSIRNMVAEAIRSLGERNGSNRKNICAYVSLYYGFNLKYIRSKIYRALRTGVASGELETSNGLYKLVHTELRRRRQTSSTLSDYLFGDASSSSHSNLSLSRSVAAMNKRRSTVATRTHADIRTQTRLPIAELPIAMIKMEKITPARDSVDVIVEEPVQEPGTAPQPEPSAQPDIAPVLTDLISDGNVHHEEGISEDKSA